jgi:hypothetical protein
MAIMGNQGSGTVLDDSKSERPKFFPVECRPASIRVTPDFMTAFALAMKDKTEFTQRFDHLPISESRHL